MCRERYFCNNVNRLIRIYAARATGYDECCFDRVTFPSVVTPNRTVDNEFRELAVRLVRVFPRRETKRAKNVSRNETDRCG